MSQQEQRTLNINAKEPKDTVDEVLLKVMDAPKKLKGENDRATS